MWVLQRDGSVFVIEEKSIAPLLALCQRGGLVTYHCITTLEEYTVALRYTSGKIDRAFLKNWTAPVLFLVCCR